MPKLTQAALRRLIKKTGRHSDGGGLYFRVIGEGKAYFVYRYRVGGRERETSLGPCPELTLAEAREKHAALRKRVVVDRADPLAEKRGAKTMQAVKAVPTFAAWPTPMSERTRATWRNAKHRYRVAADAHPVLRRDPRHAGQRNRPADRSGPVLKPLWDRAPGGGKRLRGRIQTVLDAAQAHGHIAEDKANPGAGKAILDHLLVAAEEARRARTPQGDALRSFAGVREPLARR